MYNRNLTLTDTDQASWFLWGARQTGKSTLLKHRYPDALYFDLLKTDLFQRLLRHPSQLREIVVAEQPNNPVIIDEVQKIPALLDEVHWLIENVGTQFILSGSSPRKILRNGTNLLGGRAQKTELYPLSFSEIPEFDLLRALNHGLLPRHYDAHEPKGLLEAYVGSYLEDEIIAETKIKNVHIFSGFLEKAAFSNGEMVNYTNIASECGVSSPSVKEYFEILRDTMIGRYVQAYRFKPKRRTIRAPKFYFFDIGVAKFLRKTGNIEWGSTEFGHAFEHFIYHELATYSQYSEKKFHISYWRTSSGLEVDFILGQHEVAVEVKSSNHVLYRHTKGLRAFAQEYAPKSKIVVSTDPFTRMLDDDIQVLPWKIFLEKLWDGLII